MINIIVSSDSRYPIDKTTIRTTIEDILERYKISGRIELGVQIIGDRKMHQINKRYRGIDSPTNILTFALEDATNLTHLPKVGFIAAPDNILRLGDIVISYPQVVEDAGIAGVAVDEELHQLIEHGVKHLLGQHQHD